MSGKVSVHLLLRLSVYKCTFLLEGLCPSTVSPLVTGHSSWHLCLIALFLYTEKNLTWKFWVSDISGDMFQVLCCLYGEVKFHHMSPICISIILSDNVQFNKLHLLTFSTTQDLSYHTPPLNVFSVPFPFSGCQNMSYLSKTYWNISSSLKIFPSWVPFFSLIPVLD